MIYMRQTVELARTWQINVNKNTLSVDTETLSLSRYAIEILMKQVTQPPSLD